MKLPSNKKILILGASGQLGMDLSKELSSHKSKITFVRKLKWDAQHKNNKNNVFVSVDLLEISEKKLKGLIADADIIFHLSANTNVQVKPEHERNFLIPQINFLNRIQNRKIWCAASTHQNEEVLCAKSHLKIKKNYDNI